MLKLNNFLHPHLLIQLKFIDLVLALPLKKLEMPTSTKSFSVIQIAVFYIGILHPIFLISTHISVLINVFMEVFS